MYYVYILTNQTHSVLYTGVTNNLQKRVAEHKQKVDRRSFCSRYNINQLVYYESTTEVISAIEREKQIKAGSRAKKIALINKLNPNWLDLAEDINN